MLPPLSDIEKQLTGKFTLEELEARLKPRSEEEIDEEIEKEFEENPNCPQKNTSWHDFSTGGFLALQESLLDVVRRDYHTLQELGTDYETCARMADNILKQSSREGSVSGLFRSIKKILAERHNPILTFDRDKYRFVHVLSAGVQTCPWGCSGRDAHGYSTVGSSNVYIVEKGKESTPLMEKYVTEMGKHMRSGRGKDERKILLKNIGIEFGSMDRILYLSYHAVVTDLTPHLIATHHFFEGDASYRTDPRKLWNFVNYK